MYFELKKFLDSDSGLINSNEELEELMILAKKVQTHDCEGSDSRCQKSAMISERLSVDSGSTNRVKELFLNIYHVLIQKRWSYYAKLCWLGRN